MNGRIVAALSVVLFVLNGTAAAQPTSVAFTVPLNLTQLSPDLAKVRVRCQIQGAAPASGVSSEIAVSANGQVVSTATVYVPINGDPSGGRSNVSISYVCRLEGFPRSRDTWVELRHSNTAAMTYPHVLLTPDAAPISGSFIW